MTLTPMDFRSYNLKRSILSNNTLHVDSYAFKICSIRFKTVLKRTEHLLFKTLSKK